MMLAEHICKTEDKTTEFSNIKTLWPESKGFNLDRRDTGGEYIFLYYHTPVEIFLNGTWCDVPAGSVLINDAHSHQRFRSSECKLVHDWFHVSGDMDSLMRRCGLEYGRIYPLPGAGYITELVQQMELEWVGGERYSGELTELILRQLMLRIGRDVQVHPGQRMAMKVRDRLIEARRQIHADYARDWSVEDMAALIPISPSRFYSLYKEAFRVSPKHDLHTVRITHARIFLETGRYRVREVAALTGFSGTNNFVRAFRAATGMTPAQFRG